MVLAINTVRSNPRFNIRCAAKFYNVPATTIRRRIAGKASKADKVSGKPTLTVAEEEAIVGYVLDLDSRGFSPRRADVEDMANRLLEIRGARPVGKNWTDRFIKRQELRTRLSRAYDYQRALQEDPSCGRRHLPGPPMARLNLGSPRPLKPPPRPFHNQLSSRIRWPSIKEALQHRFSPLLTNWPRL